MLPGVAVHFSPLGGTTAAVAAAIATAQASIRVQAYSFTSAPIAQALIAAHARRLDVQVILDRSNMGESYSEWMQLRSSGMPTFLDPAHAIAHNKIIILDSTIVITGSFNFTVNAEYHNAENCIFLRDADLAALYLANWQLHRNHSHV